MPRFVLRGQTVDLEKADIERDLKGVEPEVVTKHAVEANGKLYPVKQVLGTVLERRNISRLDFTSADARSILRRLGFRLFEQRERPPRKRHR